MNKQELATKIWATANELRKNIKASDYKDYILGFMFYKFLCDKEVDYLKSQGGKLDDLKKTKDVVKDTFKDDIGYFIAYENLFHVWKEIGIRLGAKNVSEAIKDFYLNLNVRYKNVFDNVFSALETKLSVLGENSGSRDKAVRDIVNLVDLIPPTSKDYDVLGYIYEYLIQQFSSEAKKDGGFYTPHQVTSLMSRILADRLKDRDEISVYDPTVGSGGLLLNIGREASRYISQDHIHYFGQELITETANLAKMNLFMRGVPVQNINMRNANTLQEDWPYFDAQTAYKPLFVDAVVSNPPYSANYEPDMHQTDERFKGYGLAPAKKADYAFLLHCLYHIKKDGVMAIVLPHGVLFRGGSEEEIRKNLILNHNIETIISLPAQLFFATGIPVIVAILSKGRREDDILFIDASQSYKKGKKQNILAESDVQRIFDAVVTRKDIPNYAHLASMVEIESNGYNLNVPRYVSAKESDVPYDLFSVMTGHVSDKELNTFSDIWKCFPALKEKLIKKNGFYNDLIDNAREVVFDDNDVQDFLDDFRSISERFEKYLINTLLVKNIDPAIYHNVTKKLFTIYKGHPLVDVYSVFQALADHWNIIDSDLARIGSEGWGICSETEPNMVTKKDPKTKKTTEEQHGWKGKVIPFNLIKSTFYAKDYDGMFQLIAKADAKAMQYADIWNNMDEDIKSSLTKENDDTTFDVKKFKDSIKKGDLDNDTMENIKNIQNAITEEKSFRKKAKLIAAELDDKAKDKIESLTEDEINTLLQRKWIVPIIKDIEKIIENVLIKFVFDFNSLKKKYSNPLSELSNDIEQTSNQLKDIIQKIVGSNTDMDAIKMLFDEL